MNTTKKSRLFAIFLSAVFGVFGVQHFYLRANKTGGIVLATSFLCSGFILGFADSFLSVLALIFMSSEEFKLRYEGIVIDRPLWWDLTDLDILKKNENYVMSKKLAAQGDDRGALAHLLVIKNDEITNCTEYWSELISLTSKVFGVEKAFPLVLEARAKGVVIQTTNTELMKLQNKCLEEERSYRKNLDDKFVESVLKREMA